MLFGDPMAGLSGGPPAGPPPNPAVLAAALYACERNLGINCSQTRTLLVWRELYHRGPMSPATLAQRLDIPVAEVVAILESPYHRRWYGFHRLKG